MNTIFFLIIDFNKDYTIKYFNSASNFRIATKYFVISNKKQIKQKKITAVTEKSIKLSLNNTLFSR